MKRGLLAGLLLCVLPVAVSTAAELYNFGSPSPQEEWMRALINRARMDPEAEADRTGLNNTHPDDIPNGAYDVGEGITISGVSNQRVYWSRYQGPRQPLAWNAALNLAAGHHCDDMHTYDFFDHFTAESSYGYLPGAAPWDRAWAEGYPNHFVGENIAANNGASAFTADDVHLALFTEPQFPGRGHRKNLLKSCWREIGVGYVSLWPNASGWTDFWATDFGNDAFYSSASDPWPPVDTVYVTGVVYDDDGDGLFQAGEQMPGIRVSVYDSNGRPLKYYANTAVGGGYSVPLINSDGSDVPEGEQIRVVFLDESAHAFVHVDRIVQGGNVIVEDTAAETPESYYQRFNVGADALLAEFVPLPAPGDTNDDGLVEGADYTVWADNYGAQPAPAWVAGGWECGNFNEDDTVEGADYTIWADNYTGGGAALPEPATLALLAAGGCLLLLRRRS